MDHQESKLLETRSRITMQVSEQLLETKRIVMQVNNYWRQGQG